MKKTAALISITTILVIILGVVFIACGDEISGDPTSPPIRPGDTPDNPIARTESRQLTAVAWVTLLNEIEGDGKYVDLDLSACTPGNHSSGGGLWIDGTFNADQFNNMEAGKRKIVSLILPEAATSIAGGRIVGEGMLPIYEKCFQYFTALKSITGINITTIGRNAFSGLGTYNAETTTFVFGTLTSINFPKVQTIGEEAFDSCYSLTSANIPKVQTIGDQAFIHSKLQNLYIPDVMYIGVQAFGWTRLTKITLGAIAPVVERQMFALTWNPRAVTVMVPQGATGYGEIPGDYIGGDITKNWGNAFRGMGWNPAKANTTVVGGGFRYDREGYCPIDFIDSAITLRIEYVP